MRDVVVYVSNWSKACEFMKAAQGRSSGRTGGFVVRWTVRILFGGCPILGLGCAVDRALVEKNLMSTRDTAQGREHVAQQYRVSCPDVVEVRVASRPEFDAHYQIGPDGKINLGEYGQLRIEGKTPAEIVNLLSQDVGAAPNQISVRVREYGARTIFLFGEVVGWQRSLPYQGQETVLDVLQRVGGITPGGEPADVYVVRPHLNDGRRPEVFHVNLQDIVMRGDAKTNIRVEPFDQIYVGETAAARVQQQLPPWMQPLYKQLWNSPPPPLNLPNLGPWPLATMGLRNSLARREENYSVEKVASPK